MHHGVSHPLKGHFIGQLNTNISEWSRRIYSQQRVSKANGISSSVRRDNVILFSLTRDMTPSTADLLASVRSLFFADPETKGCKRHISPVRIAWLGIVPPVEESRSSSTSLHVRLYKKKRNTFFRPDRFLQSL